MEIFSPLGGHLLNVSALYDGLFIGSHFYHTYVMNQCLMTSVPPARQYLC